MFRTFLNAQMLRGGSVVCLTAFLFALGGTMRAEAQTEAGFRSFVQQFRRTAISRGVNSRVYDAAFANVKLNQRVMELDKRQPEFTQPIWEYLKVRLGPKFTERGAQMMSAYGAALDQIERRYGVEKEVVGAIWGIESLYGSNRGSINVIEALATLAYEGRRRAFGSRELISALKILQSGDVAPEQMFGSWAGAMGHTQFIPSSYLSLAVDFGGDGKRDIWSDDPTDALASTANYLAKSGWKKGAPWGFQVQLPAELDFSRYNDATLSSEDWGKVGLTLSSGGPLPEGHADGKLLTPAGAAGPAFLVFGNFRALLKYNNANAYALAVALLSERLSGRPPRALAWPEEDRPLSNTDRKELQTILNKLGFGAGPVDGIIGAGTTRAIRRFQTSNSMIADGYPSSRILDDLRRALAAKSQPILRVAAGPASSEDIREIQALLRALGYQVSIDGKEGPRTEQAIDSFLRRRGANLKPEPSKEVLTELRRAVRDD